MKTITVSIDNSVIKDGNNYYADQVGYTVISRYASNFDSVHLLLRVSTTNVADKGKRTVMMDFPNITVHEVPYFNKIGQLLSNYNRIQKVIRRGMKDSGFLLVRFPSLLGLIVLKCCPKSMRYGLEIVANPYDMSNEEESSISKYYWRFFHRVLIGYAARADAIAYVTKNSLQKRYPCIKSSHIENHYSSIELGKERFITPQDRLVKPLDEIRIIHVSNVMSGNSKGHFEAIKVTKQLKDLGFKVITGFVGDGPSKSQYIQLTKELGVEENVVFYGFMNKEQLHQTLRDANVFLFPSKSEGLPKVIIEAMAASLPCVASKVGGIPELLTSDCLFDADDYKGMTMRIKKLFTDRKDYDNISQRNYETAWEYESSVLSERRKTFFGEIKKKFLAY